MVSCVSCHKLMRRSFGGGSSVNPREYWVMSELECYHWWYRGLRDIIARTIDRHCLSLGTSCLLDAGVGTGENLAFLSKQNRFAYLGGFDASQVAIDLASKKVDSADLYVSDICNPELHQDSYDVVTSCDVINIPGLERCFAGLRRIVSHIRPGGLFLANLPAYKWLFSDHDMAVHTSQRFAAGQVRKLCHELGLEPVVLTYRLCSLFPLFVLSRLPTMLFRSQSAAQARSALKRPSIIMNTLFTRIARMENSLVEAGLSLPWGSSVFVAARRPISAH